jgi:3-phosphoshikimate 1-carboxyvinyltransferase
LEALGVDIRDIPNGVVVRGTGLESPFRAPSSPLDCGNSGTTMRLLIGILSGQPFESTLIGDSSLSRRPMERVAGPLREMGADISLTDGHAPVRVSGKRPLKAIRYKLPVPSAQVKSAVLLAGLWSGGETSVEDPFASRDHTERLLAWFGGRDLRSDRELVVPGDPSSAAYFLAAAALVPGSSVTVKGVGLNPTRLGFIQALRDMGGRVASTIKGGQTGEPFGDLRGGYAELKAITISAGRIPSMVDEIPMLAVLAASARGTTRIEGLGELRHKESDRLEGTAENLRRMGAKARVEGDALVIEGPTAFQGARIETFSDHRLAMAFAVAGLAADGETILSDKECAAISYPSFFEDLGKLTS